MRLLKRFWQWLTWKPRYITAIDPSGKDGDYSAEVTAYRDRQGNIVVVGCKTWRPNSEKEPKP